MAILTKIARYD